MKKYIRWTGIAVLSPFALFVILCILLYIPPIQNFIVDTATQYASEATGMQISIGRISLSFPLDLSIKNTTVIDKQDTILDAERITAKVQLLPLFKKKIELDGMEIEKASVNTANLIEGMILKGKLGNFFIQSHGVELNPELAVVNEVTLKNTDLSLVLSNDTTEKDTTASEPVRWKIKLQKIDLENVSFAMQMPEDTLSMHAAITKASLRNGFVDLHKSSYTADKFILEEGMFSFDTGNTPATPSGLDPSHIALTNINIGVDSIYYAGNDIRALIQRFNLKERSGLEVLSTEGRLVSDAKTLKVPTLKINTQDSYMEMSASMDWDATDINKDGTIQARLMADIGKNDMLKIIPDLPQELIKKYPAVPLQIRAGLNGNLKNIRLTSLTVSLPGALRSHADGSLSFPLDSLRRQGHINMSIETGDLKFLSNLMGGTRIPSGIKLENKTNINRNRIGTEMTVTISDQGKVNLSGFYGMQDESYAADLEIDRLNIHEFLPQDSIFTLSAYLKAKGKGLDFFSRHTIAEIEGGINHLGYGSRSLSGISLNGSLLHSQAKAELNIVNTVINMSTRLDATLHPRQVVADLSAELKKIDLQALSPGSTNLKPSMELVAHLETNMKDNHKARASLKNIILDAGEKSYHTKDLNAGFTMSPDSVRCYVNAGDLVFLFKTMGSLEKFTSDANRLMTELSRQWKEKSIEQATLKNMYPQARLRVLSRSDNPLANFLAIQKIRYDRLNIDLNTSPETGLNGSAKLYGLRTDSLRLDTIYFTALQDSSELKLKSGVKALASKRQEAFNITLDGYIGTTTAQLGIKYLNDKNEEGVNLGLLAELRRRGISLHISPDTPTLVYRSFHVNKDNYIYLGDNGRIHANLNLYDDNHTGISFYSTPDSLSQQNLTVGLNHIDIGELKRIVPYMPDITGSISAEAHYIQTKEDMQVAAEVSADKLTYNKQEIGNIGMNLVYLPKESGEHTIDGFISLDNNEIMAINGSYVGASETDPDDRISADMSLSEFPLNIANAFIPDRMAVMGGKLNGTMSVDGSSDKPILNGEVSFDNTTLNIPQLSLMLQFDKDPVKIENSQLQFNNFKITTQGKSPFVINGLVDVSDLAAMQLNLKMYARNFELINAKQTKEAIVYGKLDVDFNSTMKGTFDNLQMKGNINILGSSNFTYVMTDSPLTVEDNLSETVTFVDFSDTTKVERTGLPTLALGGIDMLMTIHIDNAVQARIDLNSNGSNYMLLEGGGDLSFQYQPDGNMVMNGRYSLISGELKYQMPIIPLKTFRVQEGSYIEWTGNVMNPTLNIQASERVRASVPNDENSSRMVNFDVGVNLTNRLDNLGFTFTLAAPDDGSMQNELASKSPEEKNKLAVTMLVTGMYLSENSTSKGFDTNNMLNSFLQGEINKIAGNALKSIDINFGMENSDGTNGTSGTDYNIQFTKRFWNNRFQVVIGGKISTGNDAQQEEEAFIDNISLEYRLDNSGTRYIKLFHNKNYESILDGEVTETGAGIVLRKKVSKLGELFIFKTRKKRREKEEKQNEKEKIPAEEETKTETGNNEKK